MPAARVGDTVIVQFLGALTLPAECFGALKRFTREVPLTGTFFPRDSLGSSFPSSSLPCPVFPGPEQRGNTLPATPVSRDGGPHVLTLLSCPVWVAT